MPASAPAPWSRRSWPDVGRLVKKNGTMRTTAITGRRTRNQPTLRRPRSDSSTTPSTASCKINTLVVMPPPSPDPAETGSAPGWVEGVEIISTGGSSPRVDQLAEGYVERAAALDPALATFSGIAGHDGELTDLSADGFAERAELDRSTLAALDAAEALGPREQTVRAAMQERLAVAVERYDAGDLTSDLNVTESWVQYVREVFDLMPTEGEEAAATIARRMAAVPEAYRQFSQTLLGAARNGRPPPRRQVEEVAQQCAAWATPEDPFYEGLVSRLTGVPESLRGDLDAAARAATAATARLGGFLRGELLPLAREKDACGPDVYARASRHFLGATVDLAEAYAWSWAEVARLRAEQARVSRLIRPGATREEAVAI